MREVAEDGLSSQSLLLVSVELQNIFRIDSVVHYGKTLPVSFTVYLLPSPFSVHLPTKLGAGFFLDTQPSCIIGSGV